VSLRCLFALRGLGRADVQIKNVSLGVVIGVVEGQLPDLDVHGVHALGSLRLANAVMIRAGSCS